MSVKSTPINETISVSRGPGSPARDRIEWAPGEFFLLGTVADAATLAITDQPGFYLVEFTNTNDDSVEAGMVYFNGTTTAVSIGGTTNFLAGTVTDTDCGVEVDTGVLVAANELGQIAEVRVMSLQTTQP